MSQSLFINCKEPFVARIRAESGSATLLATSMAQGLHWVTDLDIAISGIFLNPNDLNYSALRFLEVTVKNRPATPLFLIDDENNITELQKSQLNKNFNIQGVFKGNESFNEFMGGLQYDSPESMRLIQKRISGQNPREGYIEIPLIDFIHSKEYPFDLYIEDKNHDLRLFALAGSEVDPSYLSQLNREKSWFYVQEIAVELLKKSLATAQSEFLTVDYIPHSWKTAESLYRARHLISQLKQNELSDTSVLETQNVIGNMFQLVSQINKTEQLEKLLAQAKDSDRTLICAVLSILMCKILKFEKNAIVEILGLASFLQDISLYHSPFGDLSESRVSELTGGALNYYLNHSMSSADLAARTTSIPDVTLQVLRQHHERKDRTGFPNRVGGMQLHPMSEVLSIINGYLDFEPSKNLDRDLYAHYSERVVGAFKPLVPFLERLKQQATENHKLAA